MRAAQTGAQEVRIARALMVTAHGSGSGEIPTDPQPAARRSDHPAPTAIDPCPIEAWPPPEDAPPPVPTISIEWDSDGGYSSR